MTVHKRTTIWGRISVPSGAIFGIILLSWIGISDWTYPYDEDGHFYTAVTLQHQHHPPFDGNSRDQAVLLAFCAQLPDLAKEFEAVTLRVGVIPSFWGSTWGAFSTCWGDAVCHMVTAHHYLHGLTDTDAEPVTDAAVSTLRALLRTDVNTSPLDPNRICAAGFAIHLLGDSFAHRRLTEPSRMYAPGLGHFRDDHNPDFILYNEDGKNRTGLWLNYAQKLRHALMINVEKKQWDALNAFVKQNLTGATIDNYFNESAMITALKSTLKEGTEDHKNIWAPYEPPVEKLSDKEGWWERHVLQRSCADVLKKYQPPGSNELDCNRIWEIYKNAVIPEFEARNIRSKCRPV